MKTKSVILTSAKKKKLHKLAVKALKKAYSPYSKYKVGASVLFEDGSMTSGCNIENASYGGTVCAERVAIWSGIKENLSLIKAICVVTDEPKPWPPCGLCRQVISEFQSKKGTLVLLANLKGIQQEMLFQDLMPLSFGPDHLK
jgi:cytidine deaminase